LARPLPWPVDRYYLYILLSAEHCPPSLFHIQCHSLSPQAQWEVGCPGSIKFDCCRHDLPASINRLYVPHTIFFRDSCRLSVTAFDEVHYNQCQSNLLSLVFSEIGHLTIATNRSRHKFFDCRLLLYILTTSSRANLRHSTSAAQSKNYKTLQDQWCLRVQDTSPIPSAKAI